MKIVTFVLSSIVSAGCLILSMMIFFSGKESHKLQAEMTKYQQDIQLLDQASQSKQEEFQRQQQIIEAGAAVAQKYGKNILSDVGYRAAKNNNVGLRDLLVRHQLDKSFIPSPEDLKKMEEAAKTSTVQPVAP